MSPQRNAIAILVLGAGLALLACKSDSGQGWVRDSGPEADATTGADSNTTSGKRLSFVTLDLDWAEAGRHAQIARNGNTLGIAYLRHVSDAVREANPDKYTATCPRGGEPQSADAYDVYYLAHDGTDWAETPVLVSTGNIGDPDGAIVGVPRGLSLVIDASGNPEIGHLGGALGYFVCLSSDGIIASSTDQGKSFTSRVLWGGGGYGSGDTAGHWMSLAFDCDNTLHAALRDFGSGGFETELSERAMWIYDDGEPITTAMTPNGLAGNGEGEYNRLLFDTSCRPVIMSYDSNPGVIDVAIKYTTTWTVIPAVRTRTSEQPGFATDGNGTFGIAYFSQGDKSLHVIESDDIETWGTAQIPDLSTSWHGTYASMAYDSQGNPAVAYYRCTKTPGATDCDPSEDALMFAYRRDGTWKTWEIDTGNEWYCGRYTSLVFTADDRPFIAYECTTHDTINDTFPSVLKVAEGEWQ